jgi:hypothetical protein
LSRAFTGDQDGMSGRFLYAWPATPDYYPLTDDAAEVDPVLQGLLTKLIRLPAEDENGAFAPRTIPLSKEARAEFEHYRRFVHREKRSVEGLAKQWLVKSETHLLRLAGTLAYLAWADASSGTGMESISAGLEPNEIDVRFVADAGRLIQEYFWPHAQAALRQIGLTDRHRHARRALNWCLQNDRDVVSLKDLRRDALNHALDVGETRAQVVDRLVTAGWLRAEPIVTTGGRPKERWEVNPRLFGRAESAQSAERQAQKGAEEQGVIDLSALSALPARAQKPKKGRPQ